MRRGEAVIASCPSVSPACAARPRSRYRVGLVVALAVALAASEAGAPPLQLNPRLRHRLPRYEHAFTDAAAPGIPLTAPWGIAVYQGRVTHVVMTVSHETPVLRLNKGSMSTAALAGTGGGPGECRHPRGIALGAGTDLYVADEGNSRVQVLDRETGEYRRTLVLPAGLALVAPRDVAYTAGFFEAPRIYITDKGASRVCRYHPEDGWTSWGSFGSGPGQFRGAEGVACSPDGAHVYLVDSGNHRVQKFHEDGGFIRQWGSRGDDPGQFEFPVGIAVTPTGQVLVTDTGNHRVQKFTPAGDFITAFGHPGDADDEYGFRRPRGIVVRPSEYVYVCDSGNNAVKVYRPR